MALKRWTLDVRAKDDHGDFVDLEVEAAGATSEEAGAVTEKMLTQYRYEEIKIRGIRESDPSEIDPSLLRENCGLWGEDGDGREQEAGPAYPEPPLGKTENPGPFPVRRGQEIPRVIMFLVNRPEWKDADPEPDGEPELDPQADPSGRGLEDGGTGR